MRLAYTLATGTPVRTPGLYAGVGISPDTAEENLAPLGLTWVAPTPPPAPTDAERQAAKPAGLKAAENAFLGLCSTLGFEGKASTEDCREALRAFPAEDVGDALALGLELLAMVHEVEVHGGTWADIPEEPHAL